MGLFRSDLGEPVILAKEKLLNSHEFSTQGLNQDS